MDEHWRVILTFVVAPSIMASGTIIAIILKSKLLNNLKEENKTLKEKLNGNGNKVIVQYAGSMFEVTTDLAKDLIRANKEKDETIERLISEKYNYCSTCPLKERK